MYHKDPSELWKSIGWKETTRNNEVIPSYVIYNFFTDVFQSKKTARNPNTKMLVLRMKILLLMRLW